MVGSSKNSLRGRGCFPTIIEDVIALKEVRTRAMDFKTIPVIVTDIVADQDVPVRVLYTEPPLLIPGDRVVGESVIVGAF